MSGRRPQSTIDTCSSQSRYDQKIIHHTCIDVCISSVRLVPIILVIGFDRNFEMRRAEQPGKDTRGNRKLIVSSLAVARDRMAYNMTGLLFCSPRLVSPLFGRGPSPVSADSPFSTPPRSAKNGDPQKPKGRQSKGKRVVTSQNLNLVGGMAVLCLNGGTRRRKAGRISGSRGYDDIVAISLARHGLSI